MREFFYVSFPRHGWPWAFMLRSPAGRCVNSQTEAEQVFANGSLIVIEEARHSVGVPYHALGRTNHNRMPHVTFTLRQDATLIRVISARGTNRKEARFATEREMKKTKKLKPIPKFKNEAKERILGIARHHSLCRPEQDAALEFSEPQALDHDDIAAAAAGPLGSDHDRGQQARLALPVAH